jgi:hypothetical protein
MDRRTLQLLLLFPLIFFVHCSSNPNYEAMVKRGLNSGIQQDSLFLGYYFGMTSDDFHSTSWDMNQQGLLTGYVKIEYRFNDLKNSATMEFYPDFQNGRIVRMPVEIGYDSWAPWNQQYWPEELLNDLIEHYSDIYNARFRRVYVPDLEDFAYVDIQGNREIRMYRFTDSTIMVEFIDHKRLASQES